MAAFLTTYTGYTNSRCSRCGYYNRINCYQDHTGRNHQCYMVTNTVTVPTVKKCHKFSAHFYNFCEFTEYKKVSPTCKDIALDIITNCCKHKVTKQWSGKNFNKHN